MNRLMALVTDASVDAQVRAQAFLTIQKLDQWLAKQKPGRMDRDWTAHYAQARQTIAAMLNEASRMVPAKSQPTPPGSPIGN